MTAMPNHQKIHVIFYINRNFAKIIHDVALAIKNA